MAGHVETMLSSRSYGGTSMDIPQIRKLKPRLRQFLKRFDDWAKQAVTG